MHVWLIVDSQLVISVKMYVCNTDTEREDLSGAGAGISSNLIQSQKDKNAGINMWLDIYMLHI